MYSLFTVVCLLLIGAGHYETNQAYLTMKPGISVLTEDDQEAGEYDLPPPLTLHSKNTSSATVNDRSSGVDNSAYVTIRRSQIHEEDFIEERRRGQDLPSLPPQSASILPSLPDHLNDEVRIRTLMVSGYNFD